MSRRATWLSVTALAGALACSRADALEASGWVGGRAQRYDDLSPIEASSLQLRLDAGLSAQGFLLSPSDINWAGNLRYGRNRASTYGTRSDENLLTYDGTASLFDVRESRLALRLGATRTQNDVSQLVGGPELTGTSLVNAFRANLRAGGGTIPTLSVAGSWTDSTNTGLGRPDLLRTTKALEASLAHGTESFGYQASYDGRLEEGSLAFLNYTSQFVNFNAHSALSEATNARLEAQHYVRSPGSAAATNPTMEDTRVDASTRTNGAAGNITIARYAFGHFLVDSLGVPGIESTRHSLNASGIRHLAPEWTIEPGVGVAYAEERGATETSSAGQSASATLRWQRIAAVKTVLLETRARAGLLEPLAGGLDLGWGSTALGRIDRRVGASNYGAGYQVDYDTNMNAVPGWVLRQVVTGNASWLLGPDLSLVSSLQLDSSRTHSPLVGDAATRAAILSTTLRSRNRSAGVSGAIRDGAAGALDSPIRGDAMFVPVAFQTHSRVASAFATATLAERWSTSATFRYALMSAPGLDQQRELTASGRVGYRVGQTELAVEDLYRLAGSEALDQKRNEFMFTFSRHFRH